MARPLAECKHKTAVSSRAAKVHWRVSPSLPTPKRAAIPAAERIHEKSRRNVRNTGAVIGYVPDGQVGPPRDADCRRGEQTGWIDTCSNYMGRSG